MSLDLTEINSSFCRPKEDIFHISSGEICFPSLHKREKIRPIQDKLKRTISRLDLFKIRPILQTGKLLGSKPNPAPSQDDYFLKKKKFTKQGRRKRKK